MKPNEAICAKCLGEVHFCASAGKGNATPFLSDDEESRFHAVRGWLHVRQMMAQRLTPDCYYYLEQLLVVGKKGS